MHQGLIQPKYESPSLFITHKSVQLCIACFLQRNIKVDILKNVCAVVLKSLVVLVVRDTRTVWSLASNLQHTVSSCTKFEYVETHIGKQRLEENKQLQS